MSDESPSLPEVFEAMLDDGTVDDLFFDVSLLPGPVDVRWKAAPDVRADEAPISLDEAREVLRSGRARAVQLRYVHEGKGWCDTLLRLPGGTRLVRTEIPTMG
ncbi:MAG: hypothetical protein U0230_22580 [Polyangiales bacterium]